MTEFGPLAWRVAYRLVAQDADAADCVPKAFVDALDRTPLLRCMTDTTPRVSRTSELCLQVPTMKAVEANLLSFLKKSPQFVIPIYQRTYSWAEKECRQLWADVLRAGNDKAVEVHFIGSIVYIEHGTSPVSHQSRWGGRVAAAVPAVPREVPGLRPLL